MVIFSLPRGVSAFKYLEAQLGSLANPTGLFVCARPVHMGVTVVAQILGGTDWEAASESTFAVAGLGVWCTSAATRQRRHSPSSMSQERSHQCHGHDNNVAQLHLGAHIGLGS